MPNDVRIAALRLFRILNENQAHNRTDFTVEVRPEDAEQAGLQLGSHIYDTVIGWLLDENALELDEETNAQFRRVAGVEKEGPAFFITEHGLDLLRL